MKRIFTWLVALACLTVMAQATNPCASNATPPTSYQHIVIFSFENRTWGAVGGVGFLDVNMPYLHSLTTAPCSYFSDWTETNTSQNSLTQYIGETSGVNNPATVNDCTPSTTCRSTDDNIFRQVRVAGGTARNYVEGATTSCSASGNAAKHIPALYYYGSYTVGGITHNDHDFCATEVVPYSAGLSTDFDVNNLPTYAFITPTLCNDGHDCNNTVVDGWASTNVQAVLNSNAYASGNTAVFIWYDEDHPTPNTQIAPTANVGDLTQTGLGTHAALLKTIELLLGLPVMSQGQLTTASDLRAVTRLGSTGAIAISISPTTATVVSGGTQQFTATVTGTTNTAVTWSSSAGTVSSLGLFTAPTVTSNTTVTVTAKSVADTTKTATATVTVTPASTISITISPTTATVVSGGTQQFTATVTGTTNTGVTWAASPGTVSTAGLYTAPTVTSQTTATVTATSQADTSKKATATVTITTPIVVTISPTSVTLASGATQQFTATVTGTTNLAVTWSATKGTISSSGLYTAPTVSTATTATVTATSQADTTKKANAAVSITAATPPAAPTGLTGTVN